MKKIKKPNFTITSLETGNNQVQFKMARNFEFKLPKPEDNKLNFSVPEIRRVLKPTEKPKQRTIMHRDGDFIELNHN